MEKREKILIVDDIEVNREILAEIFKKDYEILQAENGLVALEQINQHQDEVVCVLLDLIMPVMDGFEVLTQLRSNGLIKKIPVIIITDDQSTESEFKGYSAGVYDVILKPFDPQIIWRRTKNAIELYNHKNDLEKLVSIQTEEIREQARRLKESNTQIIDTLSTVVEFRNLESGMHVHRIKGYTRILMNYLVKYFPEYSFTEDEIEVIVSASVMHDIGKIAIPDTILLKPARLTPDEFEIMKTHTTRGCEIIKTVALIQDEVYFKYSYEICRHHHERYDGKGYPDGLAGEEIPIAAQVVSVADVYDALVSERVYKAAYKEEQAYEMIISGECGVFSPKILDCFKKARLEFDQLAKKKN